MMKSLLLIGALMVAVGSAATPPVDAARKSKDGFTRLFNGKNLKGFYTFLASKGKNNDPDGIFSVRDGVIRVTGTEAGYFATEKPYENYHLRFQVMWPGKERRGRNAGCLYHFEEDRVWPKSFECQLQEGNMGDFWLPGNTSVTVDGKRQTGGNIKKKVDAEKPTGEWNTVEVISDGDTLIHLVNGVEVLRGTEASQTRGKILFQSEGSELFYRNIEIKPIRKKKA